MNVRELLKRNFLPIVVFFTGASVLIVEVVAVRILSPFYGSTLFTVSSVISVILAALSLGYYVGGKRADKKPSQAYFFRIIMISALSLLLLHYLGTILLPVLSVMFSIAIGPLISSLVLFMFPAFLLGMLSPYAIKLQSIAYPDEGVGTVSGKIFFWSTLGSILGSLAAGFILIPKFGINQIMLVNGIVLFFLGFIPLLKLKVKGLVYPVLALVFLSAPLFSMVFSDNPKILYSHDGVYEKITIYDTNYAGRPTRIFQQDRSNSGAMYLDTDDPTDMVFDYTKYYQLYKIFTPDIEHALVLGGGAYTVPKALLAEIPDASIDVSEIEPELLSLSQTYFKLPETDRLFNTTIDGRRWLVDSETKYDLIFSDVYYSLYSIPTHFTTQEFFATARGALAPEGVFIANLIGDLSRQDDSLTLSLMRTMKNIFPNSYFFAVTDPSSLDTQNMIFVGYDSDRSIDISAYAQNETDPFLKELPEKMIDPKRFELSGYTVLTDNYAPVDFLTGKLLKRSFIDKSVISGEEMLAVIAQQLRYGFRYLSAPGHEKIQQFLVSELSASTDTVVEQVISHTTNEGKEIELTNIIARLHPGIEKRIIIGTHYDSKRHAHRDNQSPNLPVPGANDSASGVAVLIELARILSQKEELHVGVDFIFFDGEEGEEQIGGDFSNWQPIGSTYFAEHVDDLYPDLKPEGAVILDMVCDKDLGIRIEPSSAKNALDEYSRFFYIAQMIDGNIFKVVAGPEIHDDHTPLNNIGIPSFLIIDSNYPYFHTTGDTLDKCSAESLKAVAETVLGYIYFL